MFVSLVPGNVTVFKYTETVFSMHFQVVSQTSHLPAFIGHLLIKQLKFCGGNADDCFTMTFVAPTFVTDLLAHVDCQ